MSERVVVVGGDAAGMSAAGKVVRSGLADVTVYEREQTVSYAACGMPYHLDGRIPDAGALLVRSAEQFRSSGIDVRLGWEVLSIDPDAGTLEARDPAGETIVDTFDRLLLATGASAVRPPIEGIDSANVFVFRRYLDLGLLADFLDRERPTAITVLGGGFIGIELAEVLTERGLAVTLVEMADTLMPGAFDPDVAGALADEMRRNGVDVKLSTRVGGLTVEGDRVTGVTTGAGSWSCDAVVLGAGVRPNGELAAAAGIEVDARGAIVVDELLRTSHPNVWAAGDCATTYDRVTGERTWVPLALSANRQGRIAGDNLTGGDTRSPGLVGTSLVKAFDLQLGRTGLTEQQAVAAGLDAVATTISAGDKAHYYPGSKPTTVKLVAERGTGRVLGAQIVGNDGVAGRTNVIATALHARLTVDDVADLDLGYAPPFAPVWDPVLVAATQLAKSV